MSSVAAKSKKCRLLRTHSLSLVDLSERRRLQSINEPSSLDSETTDQEQRSKYRKSGKCSDSNGELVTRGNAHVHEALQSEAAYWTCDVNNDRIPVHVDMIECKTSDRDSACSTVQYEMVSPRYLERIERYGFWKPIQINEPMLFKNSNETYSYEKQKVNIGCYCDIAIVIPSQKTKFLKVRSS